MGNSSNNKRNCNHNSEFNPYTKSTFETENFNQNSQPNPSNNANKILNNDIKLNIKDFIFEREIGRGSFGIVKLYCKKNNNNFKIAVKELNLNGVAEREKKRIIAESTILSKINHPNIVKYYFSYNNNDCFCIAMEYCEKKDIQNFINEKIKKNEKIEENFIWKVCYQSLKALEYLHLQKKLIHHDIKPLNILITSNNDIKITDFGLSGIVPIFSFIQTGLRFSNIGNTFLFSSPEDMNEEKINFKTDIWSLGCSLYYMANLKPPFEGKNYNEIKRNIIETIPSHLDKFYSNELNTIIFKMLNKDQIKRPSAKECLDLIPIKIKNSFQSSSTPFNLLDLFKLYLDEIPFDIKEEFNELYNLIYEFPNFGIRNFICRHCNKIPIIKINDSPPFDVDCFCENKHCETTNIRLFFQNFTNNERNKINEDICSICNRMNEFHEEIKYKYCKICKKVLCRNCERIHQNEYSEHILCNEFINDNCLCLSHNKNFSNFCKDCYIHLCDDCLILHNETNINHDIIKINEIDILTIEKIKLNICDVTESIKDCEEIIKSLQCQKNKYKLFFKIN